MTTYPVLFLDYDGVLNNISTAPEGAYEFQGEFYCRYGLDPANVQNLNTICEACPDARIVITSAWRLNYKFEYLKKVLTDAGFKYADRVIGTTPNHRKLGAIRGTEIQRWLDWHVGQVSRFAILEDAEELGRLEEHCVRTHHLLGGLTADNAQKVIAKLKGDAVVAAA